MLRKLVRRIRKLVGLPQPPRFLQKEFPAHDIGAYSYGGLALRSFDQDTRVRVGKYCSIAADVQVILGGEHRIDWVSTYPFNVIRPQHRGIKGHPASKGNIEIGHDVWIGREAIIMSGVTIGDGAVVAARSVVTRDVAPYAIAGGVPAKEIRMRFDAETRSRLQALRWWDWPDERVERAVPLLLQPDIKKFLDAAEAGDI